MAPDFANALRIRIRRLIEDRNLTQQDIATALDLSRPRISQILKSARELQATLTIDRLAALADVLGVTVPTLLTDEDEHTITVTADELSLLDLYRLLPADQRAALLGLLHYTFEPRRSANQERAALRIIRQSLERQSAEQAERAKPKHR